jgi:FkbM family methyltransferase
MPVAEDITGAVKEYVVGRTKLLLPADHAIDHYQARWKRYDRALGEIARLVKGKYPDFRAIDIGANVGDSAALISTYHDVPTLCIEGTETFLPFLRENARRIGSHVAIEVAFVGDGAAGDAYALQSNDVGTAKLVVDPDRATGIQVKRLDALLAGAADFAQPRLIKIDTDGFDFQIITTSVALLSELKPVLFYEYAPFERPNGVVDGIKSYQALLQAGYRHFIIYDNFGNYLLHLTGESMAQFVDLNGFLCSNQVNGVAVYYFDICAFGPEDFDLFNALRSAELSSFFGTTPGI